MRLCCTIEIQDRGRYVSSGGGKMRRTSEVGSTSAYAPRTYRHINNLNPSGPLCRVCWHRCRVAGPAVSLHPVFTICSALGPH